MRKDLQLLRFSGRAGLGHRPQSKEKQKRHERHAFHFFEIGKSKVFHMVGFN